MAVQLTKAQQETAVGEGLAVGCLALGITAVTSNKMAVEFAFIRAWREWAWALLFPVVHASHGRNDLLRILCASPRRRGAFVAEWSSEGTWVPLLRGGLNVDEAGDLLQGSTGVPPIGWTDLAQAFVDDLGTNEVHGAS